MSSPLRVTEIEAIEALIKWGANRGRVSGEGYKSHSAHVLRARGIDSGWVKDDDEIVGDVVDVFFNADEQKLIKLFYGSIDDYRPEVIEKHFNKINASRRFNGMPLIRLEDLPPIKARRNMTALVYYYKNKFKVELVKRDANDVINSAISHVRTHLACPYMIKEAKRMRNSMVA